MFKGIKKKIIICLSLALVFSFAFALPSFAKQTISYNPANLTNLTADYEKGSLVDDTYYLVDEGTRTLSYSGMLPIGGIVFYKYGNAPFNVGAPTSAGNNGQSYSVAVDIGNLNMQIPYSTSSYVVRTRFAIGNGSSILTMTPRIDFSVYSSTGIHIKDLNYTIAGNVVYIEDTISPAEMLSGNISIRISFYFGEAWGVTGPAVWVNSTYLYLTSIVWERSEDVGDLINSTTSKNDNAQQKGEQHLVDSEIFEKDIIDSFENVFEQIPDITTYDAEIGNTLILSNIIAYCYSGLGDSFNNLWWIAVTVGILCTFIGLLVRGRKG